MATQWISRDDVVAALDMCAVLAHYDIEAGRGSSFRIHCPFHDDERPSCSVNPGKKVFHCHACGEDGNVLDFIALMEELDPETEFRAILEAAISIIGHNPTPPRTARKKGNSRGPSKRSKSAVSKQEATDATNPTTEGGQTEVAQDEQSRSSDEAHSASRKPKRKASKTKKQKTAARLANDGSLELQPNRVLEPPAFPLKLTARHEWLDAQLTRVGVSQAIVAEFGIGYEGRSNALMAKRICFPIHNAAGDLVAYSGRWASDECDADGRFMSESGREQPRYLLPKGFAKQLELFNWHRVQDRFSDLDTVVLVEGFWSVLRLEAHTIPSVALMGLSISDAQIRLLQEGGIRSVIVMLDGDDEGRDATAAIVPRLSSHFFTRSIHLQDGTKPDDCPASVFAEIKALLLGASGLRVPAQTTKNPMTESDARNESHQQKAGDCQKPATSLSLPSAQAKAHLSW